MKRNFLFSLCILCFFYKAKADHITGGEMYYVHTGIIGGEHRYNVIVKLFKACQSNRQLISPNFVSVFDKATGARIKDISVTLGRVETQNLTEPNKCITNPPNVCYEVGYYEFEVSLPASANGYILTCQVVFRIAGINNLIGNYGSIGATYTAEIPPTTAALNNSARFTASDMVVVCANNSFSYSFAAEDKDGDELRYSFCNAYQGGSFGGTNASPPAQPPYSSVPYGSGFDGATPLGKNVQIDSKTGLIKGIAPESGIYVVTVCVDEIRNGIVIATQRKDLQINITSCSIAAASLLPEYMLCKDTKTINLSNFSTSPLIKTYSWEILNSDRTPVYNTSISSFSYTFPDTGVYQVKLIINKGLECSDSIVSVARVYPGLQTGFDTKGFCFKKPTSFTNTTTNVYGSINYWNWDLGEFSASNDASDQKDVTYSYPTQGPKPVRLMVGTTKGCLDTLVQTVNIMDKPPLNLGFRDTLICANDAVKLLSKGNGNFLWSPAAGVANSNTATPTVNPFSTTTYFVDLNDDGCLNRDSVRVRVTDKVLLQAMNDTAICKGDVIQLRINSDAFVYSWSNRSQLSDATIARPIATTNGTTTYEVTASIGSCTATDQVVVTTIPYPSVTAGKDTVICAQGFANLGGTTDGNSFSWSPASSLNRATLLNPVARPGETTSYVLTAFDNKGCPKPSSDTVLVTVLPPIKPFAGRDTTVVIGQSLQLAASGGLRYLWSPATNLSSADTANPLAIFSSASESIRYKVTVFNEAGCSEDAFLTVKVFSTEPTVFVPTAFTPNGDGKNDKIKPLAVGMKKIEFFNIYNRWGQLIYTTQLNGLGWDGTIGGQVQATQSFVWMVKAIDYNGKTYFKKGVLTLIR